MYFSIISLSIHRKIERDVTQKLELIKKRVQVSNPSNYKKTADAIVLFLLKGWCFLIRACPFTLQLTFQLSIKTETQTSHIQRTSLKDNSRRKSTNSIRKAKWRLSAPMLDKWENISRSVSSTICHRASNCFMTPVGPSIWKFSRWRKGNTK